MADHKPTQRRTHRRNSRRSLVLGYTRTGKVVKRPRHAAPLPDDADGQRHVQEKFGGWEIGDHEDAWHILAEHGEREPDPEIGLWCDDWAIFHKHLGAH